MDSDIGPQAASQPVLEFYRDQRVEAKICERLVRIELLLIDRYERRKFFGLLRENDCACLFETAGSSEASFYVHTAIDGGRGGAIAVIYGCIRPHGCCVSYGCNQLSFLGFRQRETADDL